MCARVYVCLPQLLQFLYDFFILIIDFFLNRLSGVYFNMVCINVRVLNIQ